MIVIVTDSTAALNRSDAEKYGAVIVPMSYSMGGHAFYSESYADENGMFEQLLTKNPDQHKTSQASFSAYLSTFDDIISQGNSVLCLTISSRLSGTYGNAVMAAKEMNTDRICVLDSRTTGAGLYLLVREARKLLDRGHGLHETVTELRHMRDRLRCIFSVDDMTPLRRSGRLGRVRMSVSTVLNIKPILRCQDGAIVSTGLARGRHEQMRALQNAVPSTATYMVIQYVGSPEQAEKLQTAISPYGIVRMRNFGPVLSIHLGIGAIGVAWIEK